MKNILISAATLFALTNAVSYDGVNITEDQNCWK